jgi:hypothetical protein
MPTVSHAATAVISTIDPGSAVGHLSRIGIPAIGSDSTYALHEIGAGPKLKAATVVYEARAIIGQTLEGERWWNGRTIIRQPCHPVVPISLTA